MVAIALAYIGARVLGGLRVGEVELGMYFAHRRVDVIALFSIDHLLIVFLSEEKPDATFCDIGTAADFGVRVGAAAVARGHDVVCEGERPPGWC